MRRGNSENSSGGQDEPGLLGGPEGQTRSREAAGRSLGLVAGLGTPSNGKESAGMSAELVAFGTCHHHLPLSGGDGVTL